MQRSTRIRIAAMVATVAMVVGVAAPAFAATLLNIDGSTTVYPLGTTWAKAYMKGHSGWTISVSGGGSGTGVKDAESGHVAIGMSSRSKASNDPSDLVFTPVARDVLTIVINPKLYSSYKSYISRLTIMQVQKIFRGQITNWKQINSHLPSHAIDLMGRTGSSGTYSYFKDMFLTNSSGSGLVGSSKYTQSSRTRQFASNGMVRSSVAGDKYAIGYLSEAYVDGSVHAMALQQPANRILVDGSTRATSSSAAGHYITPSLTTAKNGTYVYVRPVFFVTKGAAANAAKTFLTWCLSSAGQSYCSGQHFLTLR
jgi:phosphate transport system substrate-binding protein